MKIPVMKLLLSLFSAACALSGWSQTYTDSASHSAVFLVQENARVEIENKYGDVVFEFWERREVKIDVEVRVRSKKEENLAGIIELAQIDLQRKGAFIIGKTVWGKSSSIWSKTTNELRSIFGADQGVEIDYKVYMPNDVPIDVRNKYGDVFIPATKAELYADVAHGNLRARSVSNPLQINVAYGKFIADEMGSGKLNLEFAELSLQKAQRLQVNSRSSQVRIEEAERLDFSSKNDQIAIGKIGQLTGSYNFANITIGKLLQMADLSQDYGDLKVEEVSADFRSIAIRPKKGNVTLEMAPNAAFDFSVYLLKGVQFASVPELISLTRDESVGDERQMEGYWVRKGTGKKIDIRGENAVVRIAKGY